MATPLHVLTGFLGSGKTTMLAALLQQPSDERIAVLVNEVGELDIDHHLLERIDEDIVALSSGCVCCSMRGEMLQSVHRVLAMRPTRMVLETSGVADPAPILHGLFQDQELASRLQIAGVIAVADSSRIDDLLDNQPEVRRQLEFADRIALTKGDLAPERLAVAHARLTAAAPGCDIREVAHGQVDRDWLLASTALLRLQDASTAQLWLHHNEQSQAIQTHNVSIPTAARIDLIQLWLRLVTQLDGHRLLRAKGLIECSETGEIFALQSAGHAVSPPRRLGVRPAGVHGVRMVLIERGLPAIACQQAIAALHAATDGSLMLPRATPPA